MNKNTVGRTIRGDADAAARRQAVRDLVGKGVVGSQAELARLLADQGFNTTQATLSRDLKALRIGKVPADGQGYVYVLPPAPAVEARNPALATPLELEAFVREVRPVGNLVLVRTPPGNAQGVGRAIDTLEWPEVEGTISGDDTVLVVVGSTQNAMVFCQRLTELVGQGI
jgi:transcriptional regulator of arginine metabolism